jgi:hypothetical protein
MSLQDQIQADVGDIFLNTEDFAVEITYTPQGGTPKTIKAIVTEGQDTELYTGTTVFDFIVTEILISSIDNTDGHVAPLETGRTGAGDKVNLPVHSDDFYVKKILEDGLDAATHMHRLLIANTAGLLLTE